jgi:hypothetical protein
LENTKLTTLLNHFPLEIWTYHTPLAWYEQENLGHKAHIEALPPVLWFLRLYSFKGRLQRPSKLGEVKTSIVHITVCIVRLKRSGTSLREKAGFNGKQANGVGTQLMKRETGHSLHSVTTML